MGFSAPLNAIKRMEKDYVSIVLTVSGNNNCVSLVLFCVQIKRLCSGGFPDIFLFLNFLNVTNFAYANR